MTNIKDLLASKTVLPSLANTQVSKSFGIVTRANEKDNVCDIIYIDNSGKRSNKTNVEVLIKSRDDNYFPHLYEYVEVEEIGNDNNIKITGTYICDKDSTYIERVDKDIYPSKKTVTRGKIS